jgi:DNA ligase 4
MGLPIEVPKCTKGHGCRHVCSLLSKSADSCYVETKYDGQRMQIHVNLSLPFDKQIKIFSKDLNDSTKRRQEILP